MLGKLFVLCLSLSVAFAGSLDAQTSKIGKGLGFKVEDLRKPSSFQLQSNETCAAAIDVAVGLAQSCPAFTLFDSTVIFNLTYVTDVVTNHCATGGCRDLFRTAIMSLLTECEFFDEDDVSFLLLLNSIPCVQVESVDCFPSTKMFLQRLETAETDPLDDADLDAGCNACTAATVLSWISFESRPEARFYISYLDFICMKRDGLWCTTKFQALQAAFESEVDAFDSLVTNAADVCHPCNIGYLNGYLNLVTLALQWNADHSTDVAFTEIQTARAMLTYICVQNGGAYCSQTVRGLEATFDAVGVICDSVGQGVPCPGSDCQTAVRAVVGELGCCLGSLLDFFDRVCAYNLAHNIPCDPSQTMVRFLIATACQVPVPDSCALNRRLALELLVENLKFEWCTNNWDACKALIIETLALKLGVEASSLDEAVITSDAEPAAGRRLLQTGDSVEFSVSGISSESGIFAVPNPTGGVKAPVSARADETSATTLTTTKSTESSGSIVVPSAFLLLVSLAFASLL